MKNQKLSTEVLKKKSKTYSVVDSAFFNASLGLGERYISAYAVALNATANQIGLLSSLPSLLGPLSQLFTTRTMEKISRRTICSKAILWQALMWLPIALVSASFLRGSNLSPFLLILFFTLYALFGNFVSPAWVSWIGDVVSKKEIGQFLGLRNSLGSISALAAMFLGGFILEMFELKTNKGSTILIGFILIFLLAFIFRLISRYYLLKQYEPKLKPQKDFYFSFWNFIKSAPRKNYGRLAIYYTLMTASVNLVGPFYTIYMLKDLHFSYLQFMLMQVANGVATFIFMPLWGEFAAKYGSIYTVKITGFLMPMLCFLWPLSILLPQPLNFYFLLGVNFFGGSAWAGFELASSNFLFDASIPERRSLCTAYSNILFGFAVIIGTTVGGLLISNLKISFINVIMFVSLISGIARYTVSFIMTPRLREVREIKFKS